MSDGERELTDDEERFLHGRCHLLAVALHRLTGLRIGAWLDEDHEVGEDAVVLVHAFVIEGGDAIDIRGRTSLDRVLDDEFDTWSPWFASSSEIEVMALGEGGPLLADTEGWDDELVAAEDLVERLDLPKVSPYRLSPGGM